jgi:hypothetical protein
MRKKPKTTIAIPGFDDPRITGIIFHYYLYASSQSTTTNEGIEALYQPHTRDMSASRSYASGAGQFPQR